MKNTCSFINHVNIVNNFHCSKR